MSQTLTLENIHKSFGGTQALAGVSFDIQPGEVIALLGPSGCGKSTLLNIIAGLEQPDGGEILWGGKPLDSIPPHQRSFGLMFQDYALFPHMNVARNIGFGLQMQGQKSEDIHQQVQQALELVGLPGFGSRDISTLSGGEQQRVALARALAPQPQLLMLDEPLGSLDRALRRRLLADLQTILQRAGQTTLYVTHDQEEAYSLADRVVLMQAGKIAQTGTPRQLYLHPASVFVAQFLGLDNILPGRADGPQADTPIGPLPLPSPTRGLVSILLRPDTVRLGPGGPYQLTGRLRQVSFKGSLTQAFIQINELNLTFFFDSQDPLPTVGEEITLHFDPRQTIQLLENPS